MTPPPATGRPAILAVLLCLLVMPSLAQRPPAGNGACLSCHADDIPVLANRTCVSCHRGNMSVLGGHQFLQDDPGFHLLVVLAGAGLLTGAVLLAGSARRRASLAVLLAAGPIAAPLCPPSPPAPRPPPWAGARQVTIGRAADLIPIPSPTGEAILFPGPSRSPQHPPGATQALYLQRREGEQPVQLTPGVLDFAAGMAAWSPDGSTLVTPIPLADTDGDGQLSYADRLGLALFDRDGTPLATLHPDAEDLTDPLFSACGHRLAYVDGAAVGVWDLVAGSRKIVAPNPGDGRFPRLAGWSPSGRWPLFTPGYDYGRLGRDAAGRYRLPPNVPLEWAGRPTPPAAPTGPPRRRARATSAPGGPFLLAQSPGGPRRLWRLDHSGEHPWSPEDVHILACSPGPGGVWVLFSATPGHPAYLAHLPGPDRMNLRGGPFRPRWLGLSNGGSGPALAAVTDASGRGRLLLLPPDGGHPVPLADGPGLWLYPATGKNLLAAVSVRLDTDGDKRLTPLDEGELWVSWEEP